MLAITDGFDADGNVLIASPVNKAPAARDKNKISIVQEKNYLV